MDPDQIIVCLTGAAKMNWLRREDSVEEVLRGIQDKHPRLQGDLPINLEVFEVQEEPQPILSALVLNRNNRGLSQVFDGEPPGCALIMDTHLVGPARPFLLRSFVDSVEACAWLTKIARKVPGIAGILGSTRGGTPVAAVQLTRLLND